MNGDEKSRREFLVRSGGAGAALLFADIDQVRDAIEWALRRRHVRGQSFENLTSRQGATLEAAAARIVPSDDGTPGAREAGVIHFLDRAVGGFGQESKPDFERFVTELDQRAAREDPSVPYAELPAERQDALLRDIEEEEYFETVRSFTIGGMFVLPSWGGNRDWVGWELIGQDRQPVYQPPFGWYDARQSGGAG